MSEHEDHEILRRDCPDCAAELDNLERVFGRPPKRMSREEQAEMEADRELMRDEFHVR